MSAFRPIHKAFILAAALLSWGAASAQGNCQNGSQYGSATPDPFGALTTISSCSFEIEYSLVTGITAGANYQFTSSSGGYITVRQDFPGGTVIGQGYSPVTVTAVTNGDLYPHWNTNDQCGTATNCIVTTVQLFLNCTPVQATYTITDDCNTNTFSIDVNVLSTGDGSFVNIDHSINGTPQTQLPGLGVGVVTLGPFTVGSIVDITVGHELEAACSVTFTGLESTGLCPVIIDCGGVEYNGSYCYGPSDSKFWWYQSSTNDPLALLFSSGTIESSSWDHLTIYDGPNDQSPVLWNHNGPTFDLSTLPPIVSTGPNLYMKMTSDGSVSCTSMTNWTWNWTVGCLDCDVPAATFSVVPDCIHRQYSIEVNVTSTGDASTVDLVLPGDTLFGIGTGIQNFGPIGMDTVVNLAVFNGDNSLCRIFSGPVVAYEDSCVIPACLNVNTSYCYENSDDGWFVYQSSDPNLPITITFLQGQMLVDDKVVVYNGAYDLAGVLFNGNLGGDLTGLSISSANPDNLLTLRVQSNATGSCEDGQATIPLVWDVGCGLVGIADQAIAPVDFTLYPNPTTGLVTLQLGVDQLTNAVVRVYDLTGRQVIDLPVRTVNDRSLTVDLSGLQNGNYLLQVHADEFVRTRTVQVAR
ncbi:MAG: T9SS type A sorting domain-containing protein [Flavobacteriales bacterium]|nr:T9SS type A sorting domain-containing protein [Flavobacteriales bacterium]